MSGELYEVAEIGEVDELEGHPNWYTREEIKVKNKSGNIIQANGYIFHKADQEMKSKPGFFGYSASSGPGKGQFQLNHVT